MQDLGKTKQAAMPFLIDGARPAVGSVPVLDSWRDGGDKTNSASDKEC